MKKKSADLFAGFTLNEIVEKVFSSKKLQPILDRTVEQMMKVKSRLDVKLESLSKLLTEKKKKKKPAKKMKRPVPPSHAEPHKDAPSPESSEPQG